MSDGGEGRTSAPPSTRRRWKATLLAALCLCAGIATGTAVAARGALADRTPGTLTRAAETAPVVAPDPAHVAPALRSAPREPAARRRPPRRAFTLAVTGDLLPHLPVMEQARAYAKDSGAEYDFRPMLAPVRTWLRSTDLSLCHLEVPLSADNRDLSSYPLFNGPRELATALHDAGYDGCSTASNHSYDQGADGVGSTLRVLDAAGIGHTGMARSRRESRRVRLYDAGGVTVGHLSYATWLNGLTLPADRPWLVAEAEARRIRSDARRARRLGAEFVVVSLHWGAEYMTQPTPEQRQLARQLATSPHVDLLVGHHAHVVQPVERLRGTVVAFGLGNFLSNQSSACCVASTQDGVIVTFTVKEQADRDSFRVTHVQYVPTFVDRPGYRVLPVRRASRNPRTDPELLPSLRASLERTSAAIGDLAQLDPSPAGGAP